VSGFGLDNSDVDMSLILPLRERGGNKITLLFALRRHLRKGILLKFQCPVLKT
jgi:hypothetical protein